MHKEQEQSVFVQRVRLIASRAGCRLALPNTVEMGSAYVDVFLGAVDDAVMVPIQWVVDMVIVIALQTDET